MQTVPLLVFLLKKYGNTALTHDEKSLLHVAARYDQTGVAALLLADENDFINSKDLEGNTPAHIAASCHHLKTLELIQVHPQFNPYAVNNLGETIDEASSVNKCLWQLCKHGSASTVTALLALDAKSLYDSEGNSVLYAAFTSQIDRIEKCIALIRSQPMLLNQKNKKGETLLHKATMARDESFVEFLLNQEAIEKNSIDFDHMTPVHRALDRTSVDLVKTFLRHGVDTSLRNKLGRSCIHTSVLRNQMDILKELLKVEDVEISVKDHFGRRSPFQLAVDGGRLPAVWRLASHPAFHRDHHEPESSQVYFTTICHTILTVKCLCLQALVCFFSAPKLT